MQATHENLLHGLTRPLQLFDHTKHKRQSLTRIDYIVHVFGIFHVIVYEPKELRVIQIPGNTEFAQMSVPLLDGVQPIDPVGIKIQAVAER